MLPFFHIPSLSDTVRYEEDNNCTFNGLPFILDEKLFSKIDGMLTFFDAGSVYH